MLKATNAQNTLTACIFFAYFTILIHVYSKKLEIDIPAREKNHQIKIQHQYTNSNLLIQDFDSLTILKRNDLLNNTNRSSDLRTWLHYYRLGLYSDKIPHKIEYGHFRTGHRNILRYAGFHYDPPDIRSYCTNQSLWNREGRFPSVNERIKIYMGKWYNFKPKVCLFDDNFRNKAKNKAIYQQLRKEPEIFGKPVIFYPNDLKDVRLNKWNRREFEINSGVRYYLFDFIDLAIIHQNRTTPVLLKFGDNPSTINEDLNYSFPIFGKVRDLVAERSKNHVRYPFKLDDNKRLHKNGPDVFGGIIHKMIVWPLNQRRHFRIVATTPLLDIPWNEKKAKLVFRGRNIKNWSESLPIELNPAKQRREAVVRHINSKFVDAKFSQNCISWKVCGHLSQKDTLKYKYILSIEGNDVSSGLKWMLFSNSVVFLPPVTYESWALESLLEPFVHYIPVFSNMTNLEQMVKWANNNPEKAELIAKRSTLFMYDLLFHPNAFIDDELVKRGIMDRYENNFKCES